MWTVPDFAQRRMVDRVRNRARFVPGTLEVVYSRSRLASSNVNADAAERHAGATLEREIDLRNDSIVRVLHVAAGSEATAITELRSVPGVKTVARAQYRYQQDAAVASVNDPYWTRQGAGSPPFYQTNAQGGQWDMHLICVSRAWGYAQSTGNTFGVIPGVLAGSVKLAIIDTGIDTAHPDLAGKVIYQRSYVNGDGSQTGTNVHDNQGHGTDVAGIAAADTNDGFGFVGAGYNAQIMAYQVFPDPSCAGCETGASTSDIAAAINDAVTNGAKVISMSLGGSPDPGYSCGDPIHGDDPAELAAISNALSQNVTVVAATGNEGTPALDCPGGDPGVIGVGASSLNDANPATITETVASYSNYDPSNLQFGVIAPGGDPQGGADGDFYHWIENIWSSTASDGSGSCATADVFGETGNCRILIAGTSMATPHVSGVVALMLGAAPTLTPAQVKSYLCSTAIDIGDPREGCGRIDAYRAVARAVGDSHVP